jgi:hypothetical protein
MELKRNREISIKSWINDKVISDESWEIWSNDEEDVLYILMKDPQSGAEVKLKIEKSTQSTTESPNS